MSKKKTAIDRAIESLEADIVSMRLTYEAQAAALEAAVSKLRAERSRVPARRKKPGPVEQATSDGSIGTGGAR